MPIIRPSGFAVAATPDVNANNPVILWENLITTANVATDTEEAENPATNLANPSTSALWRAADTTDQDIVITLAGETIDGIGIARHNLGSSGVPLTISVDDGGGYDTIIPEFTPDDDSPLFFQFTPQVAQAVTIRLNTGGADPAEIAVLMVGTILTLQRRIYVDHTPLPLARRIEVTTGRSQSGEHLGTVIMGEWRSGSIRQANLTPSWYRTYLAPFVENAPEPFFFAWRPDGYPDEAAFCWCTGDPVPTNSRSNGMMSIEFEVEAIP